MKIPSNKQWTVDHSGDTFGILGDNTNITFDKKGKAIMARKSALVYGSDNNEDFRYPVVINYFSNNYIVLTSDNIFQMAFPNATATELTDAPSVGLNSDAVVFNSLYTFSTNNSIYTWNGSSGWTNRSVSITTDVPHPLEVFGTLCAVGNGNTVRLINTSYTATQTLTLPTEFRVTTIRAVNDYLYIGTRNMNGGNAKIFIWDGDSSLFNFEVEVGANWVFSMTPYLSTVAAITSAGQLGTVNGTSFQELAGLPVYFDPYAVWQGAGGLTLNGKVFNRGVATIGDNIYLNIDGSMESGVIPEMKSGIWVYDPTVGLYHMASQSYTRKIIDQGLSRSGDFLTTSANHNLKKGDAVSFSSLGNITGIQSGTVYYVDPVAPNQIKLSGTRKALQAGKYITLGGTPSVSDTLVYTQNADFGDRNANSGALIATISEETLLKQMPTPILWGCRLDDVDGDAAYGLFSFTDSYNIGQITTQRIYSDNLTQSWKQLYQFIDGLIVDSEEIVVKARTQDNEVNVVTGIWAETNVLTHPNASQWSFFTDIEEGDEIVFTSGLGRGQTAHVIAIEATASTVQLTLDTAVGTPGQSSNFYYTHFKKIGVTLTIENKDKYLSSNLSEIKPSPWVEIKVEMRGFETAVNQLDLSNEMHEKGQ